METLERMRALLRDKQELFLQYETETQKLLTEDLEAVDQIAEAVDAREALISRINAIDVKLRETAAASEGGLRLYEIAKNRCDYGTLSREEQQLFQDGQQIYTVMTRIQEMEKRARTGMEKITGALQEKIRQSNTNTRFSGYLKQMDTGAKGVLYDKKR